MDSFKEVMIEMCRLQSEVAQANARLEKRGIVPTHNRPLMRNDG